MRLSQLKTNYTSCAFLGPGESEVCSFCAAVKPSQQRNAKVLSPFMNGGIYIMLEAESAAG